MRLCRMFRTLYPRRSQRVLHRVALDFTETAGGRRPVVVSDVLYPCRPPVGFTPVGTDDKGWTVPGRTSSLSGKSTHPTLPQLPGVPDFRVGSCSSVVRVDFEGVTGSYPHGSGD